VSLAAASPDQSREFAPLELRKGFADGGARALDLRFDLGDRTAEPLASFFDPFGLVTRPGRKALGVRGKAGAECEQAGEQAPLGFELAPGRADEAFANAHDAHFLISLLTSG
jgi:hypothetical protein